MFNFMARLPYPGKKKKKKFRYPCTVGWVGRTDDLDPLEKGKTLYGKFGFKDDKAGILR